jgi:flagellar hook-associated protein 1 FlgK
MSIISTLSLAAEALKAHQYGLQTTGHNVANVATPGYSRQRIELVSAVPSFVGGMFVGNGVDAAGVQRVLDRFAESELLNANVAVGYTEARHQALSAIEQVFPTSGGIDAALSAFFGALSDLSNNPSGQPERVSVIGKANALGESFRQTRSMLLSVQTHLDQDLTAAASELNVLTEQVATLNREIALSEASGEPANDLRDQRQVLLQRLARLAGAVVREESDGQATVTAGNLLFVSGSRAASLDTSTLGASGLRVLQYQAPDGLTFDATALVTQGEIGSILTMRDVELADTLDRLDLLAKSLVDEVNARHSAGFDLDGIAGGNLFSPLGAVANAAGLVQVDGSVAANPRLIAAAQTAAGAPGDNRNALSLVSLQNVSLAALGNQSLPDYFLSLLGEIGETAQMVEGKLEFETAYLNQVQARRESASGVSMDEEMTKLILFQRAFEASSLLVRTAAEMYVSLIEMAR